LASLMTRVVVPAWWVQVDPMLGVWLVSAVPEVSVKVSLEVVVSPRRHWLRAPVVLLTAVA